MKKGCSEFPESYPRFKDFDPSGGYQFKFPKEWDTVEEKFFQEHSETTKLHVNTPLGVSLDRILIYLNWLSYAKGIGDDSAAMFSKRIHINKAINDAARARATSGLV